MPDTLFDDTTNEVDPAKNYHDELVGPDKKFKTDEELARGKFESDAFIPKLTAENAELRAELERRKTMEDFINQMEALRTTPPSNNGNNQRLNEESPTPPSQPVDLDSEIERVLTVRQTKDREVQNLNYVAEVLSQNLGPGYATILAQKAKELGVGLKYVDELAKTSPKAVFSLFGVSETVTKAPNAAAGMRINPGSASGLKKNFEFYEQIRKTDPTRYFSTAVFNEMSDQLREHGEAFYTK